MPDLTNKLLGALLLEHHIITQDELDSAMESQKRNGKKLGKILLENGVLDDLLLYAYLGKQMGIEFKTGIPFIPGETAFKKLPIEFCRKKHIVPVSVDDRTIRIYLSDPANTAIINEITFMTGQTVIVDYATENAIHEYFQDFLKSDSGKIETPHKKTHAPDTPAVRFVEDMIRSALERGASDIHLEIYEKRAVLKYRIDGVLQDQTPPEFSIYPAVISRIKILSELDISEKRLPQDGKLSFHNGHSAVDVRISIIPTVFGENIVLRLLDRDRSALTMESLGLSPADCVFLKKEAVKPNGMILVTGPTGSGKTTTLYALINYIRQFGGKILTIEDPVEYRIEGVSQVQTHSEIGLTFASGLRAFLRHDPDIMMVGEIRDRETAEIAVRAALTGHLVLSTIHTNHSAGAVTRLIDMGIAPYLLTATLNAVLAQRLVRKICPHCKTEKLWTAEDSLRTGISLSEGLKYFSGSGCKKCGQTGYLGRTAVFETLPMSRTLQKGILAGLSSYELEEAARADGFKTIRDNAIGLIKEGITSPEEAGKMIGEPI